MTRRTASPRDARDALKAFDSRDIKLPKPVTEAVKHLDRVEAQRPDDLPFDHVATAYLGNGGPDAVTKAATELLTADTRRTGWTQALATATQGVLDAVLAARDELHAALREQAEATIDRLERIADLGTTSLAQLVSAGRHDDATLLAGKEIDLAALEQSYRVRDIYLTGLRERYGTEAVHCGRYVDPRTAQGSTDVVAAIQNGAQAWFPTVLEAVAAAEPITAELQQRAHEQRHAAQMAGF